MTTVGRARTTSASVAIGTASVFVLAAACLSLVVDQDADGPPRLGAGWHLRGGLAPTDGALAPTQRCGAARPCTFFA